MITIRNTLIYTLRYSLILILILTPSIGDEGDNTTLIGPDILIVTDMIKPNSLLKSLTNSPLTTKDSLNAHTLQQLPKNAIVITHNGGDGLIYNANVINAIQNTTTPYKLISIGSPISKNDLIKITADVGAELIAQINHPYDPVSGILNTEESKIKVIEGYIKTYIEYFKTDFSVFSSILGLLKSPFIVFKNQISKYHDFKSYYQNPDFKIQQIMQESLQEE